MSTQPLVIPRINANDDELALLAIHVAVGQSVVEGQVLAEVETSKAVVELNAPCAGYVLRIDMSAGHNVPVGQPLLWLGKNATDLAPTPSASPALDTSVIGKRRITTKALLLLRQLNLDEREIPSGDKELTREDVERYVLSRPAGSERGEHAPAPSEDNPADEQMVELTSWERAMCDSLSWHRDEAVPCYLEVPLDVEGWDHYASTAFSGREAMVSPLLALMAYRAVEAVGYFPRANAILSGRHYHFRQSVNLGFMVKTPKGLVMVSVNNSNRMDTFEFVSALSRLQRRAFSSKLRPDESSGATLAFTSLANVGVVRHMPALPPKCSLIIAHSAPQDSLARLGVTYDHRVLDGDTAASFLNFIANPPKP
ncbi:hypothetical protein HGP14_34855 [Rhizobium sp. P32RR-XVIII]|uniref:2-oxo acid dehydrogenase subunit E2 n=1 Tax=Rhizobium sp. P32RR-XVIII TaxID=2726738 RepID=UPI001456C971|nr:2-oxo acid dehydrogenase subunit E2 [Rhizobium sp. P32RR-XVIII]NLS08359.1 hypothetical protein [Rhizobium sp. P32RR-XVIII]